MTDADKDVVECVAGAAAGTNACNQISTTRVMLQGWPEPHIYTPYMTVYMVISLPKIPYIHCVIM
jgi:hypothetical protein